ncbi:MAG: shikimate kinase [Paracoccaceae bacterium]
MTYVLKKTVVLVGMMGSGKTAVGTALARLLHVPFLDSDEEIEIAAARTIAEIFERDGELFFRTRESQIISRLLDDRCGILSTGGGAYLAPENQRIISDKGVAVWLRADIDILWARVRHKNTRPLLQTANPRKTLEELCLEREKSYSNADLVVDAHSSYSIDAMAVKVVDALLTRPDVLERK